MTEARAAYLAALDAQKEAFEANERVQVRLKNLSAEAGETREALKAAEREATAFLDAYLRERAPAP